MRVVENNRGPFSQPVMTKGNKRKTVNVINQYETSDEGVTASGKLCMHIAKSVNFKACRKFFDRQLKDEFEGSCDDCSRIEEIADPSNSGIWLCLQCAYQGCGRYTKHKHALDHSQAPRSDPHKIAVNITTWMIWCYECDNELPLSTSKRLEEVVGFVRLRVTGEKIPAAQSRIEAEPRSSSRVGGTRANKPYPSNGSVVNTTVSGGGQPRVKGLSNLGNTCFFNAVLQALGQARELHHLLSKRQGEPEVQLPGFRDLVRDIASDADMEPDNHKPFAVDALTIRLAARPDHTPQMTEEVVNTLRDMAESQGQVVNPRCLFSKVCAKVPRFKGYQQQDSHELLRNLMDGLKTEEHKKMKAGIVKAFNVNEQNKTDFRADKVLAERIKSYGAQAQYSTVIDNLFGGYLLSTVFCEKCKNVSQMFEPFLDLSLPVYEEKVKRGPVSRKNSRSNQDDDIPSTKPLPRSKHQLKKEKKNLRRGKRIDLAAVETAQPSTELNGTNGSGNAASNLKSPAEEASKVQQSAGDATKRESPTQMPCAVEKPSDGSPEPNRRPNSAYSDASSISRSSLDASNHSEGYNSDSEGADNVVEHTRQEDRSYGTSDHAEGLAENLDSLKIDGMAERNITQEVIELSRKPLGSPLESQSHECSVQSCLGQFTHRELLTGLNRYACDFCNKMARRNNTSNSNSKDCAKTILCDASKQLLIFSPPAILTLHLKRFQQHGFSLTKVNRHVEFDMVLDIAPYCSSLAACVQPGQTEVQYLLFAVVEHSGRLSGGHYTAYVKVREKGRAHLSFLQTSLYKERPLSVLLERMEQLFGESADNVPNGASGHTLDDAKPSRWYHVSDSHVREASEKQVLSSQAYMLLYERML